MEQNIERYNSFNNYLRKKYGSKVYKLGLSISSTCPNRDGTKGIGGCIFCYEGSGTFSSKPEFDVDKQIENAKEKVIAKTKDNKFIAYFQAYTSTYAPIDFLRENFYKAINRDEIVALSISTRPDCLPDEVVDLLAELNKIKPVTVELGLQTMHEKTAQLINRCYPLSTFENAVNKLQKHGIEIVVHIILGLPHETTEAVLQTIHYLNSLKINGIKLQLLHVLKDTKLCKMYSNGEFKTLSMDEYIKLLRLCIENLSEEIVIHRLTGDAPKSALIAPLWSADKKNVLNTIKKEFEIHNVQQGTGLK